jgi:hypothetical protein
MSIDSSGAHRIYQPNPDAEAQAALERDPRDWTGAGHLPPAWIAALADIDPLTPHGVDISGTWVAFTVAAATDDPAVMCSALRQLSRVVADTPASAPAVPVIERRLPRQIGSARWHTPTGDVTVIQPGQARHRRPSHRRFNALAVPVAAVSALLHGLKSSAAPLGAAAGIAAVALVPALPSPLTTPPRPVPGHTREAFVPARSIPVAAPRPTRHPQPSPRRIPMAAPAPAAAATTTTDPAGSEPQTPPAIALPSVPATDPTATPTPTASPSTSATPKVKRIHPSKAVKPVVQRVCVTIPVPLPHKKATTCKR